jgi:predicted DNA-binding antitoxin AbrB/MazE fold protein
MKCGKMPFMEGCMLIIQGYFEKNVFHPDTDVSIPDGKKAVVTVIDEEAGSNEKKSRQITALDEFFSGVAADPKELTEEFDSVIAQRLQLREVHF